MKKQAAILLIVVIATAMLLLTSCDEFFPSERSLDHITVSPQSRFMKTGDTMQLSVTGVNGNGVTQDLTSSATYSASPTGIVNISASGLVTAAANGSATITVSAEGQSATVQANVFAGTLQSINVTPNAPTVRLTQTQQLAAQGQFSDNTTPDITSLVAWTSDNTAVATVSNTGLVTAVSAGTGITATATITASATTATGQVSGTTTVTVSNF